MEQGLLVGRDGVARCAWAGDNPLYVAYHDGEWGRPVRDDVRLFEKLCLEGFQAGLAWITVLRKRPAFREVFHGFDAERVAGMGEDDVLRLLDDARIIRHRGKIEATIGNARALLSMLDDVGTLAEHVWSFRQPGDGVRPTSGTAVPASTPASAALSKDLKRRGWRFVGPTTCYAFLQSMGVVDDHLAGCHVPPGPTDHQR